MGVASRRGSSPQLGYRPLAPTGPTGVPARERTSPLVAPPSLQLPGRTSPPRSLPPIGAVSPLQASSHPGLARFGDAFSRLQQTGARRSRSRSPVLRHPSQSGSPSPPRRPSPPPVRVASPDWATGGKRATFAYQHVSSNGVTEFKFTTEAVGCRRCTKGWDVWRRVVKEDEMYLLLNTNALWCNKAF